jgi:hypothetical protein
MRRRCGSGGCRGLEPQITIGLLTGQDGFPLMVSAFEGNKAETKTMLPVIETFRTVPVFVSADEFPAPRMSSSAMTGGHDGQG